MTVRNELTAKVITLLPDQEILPLDQALVSWWSNFKPDGGFRLSNEGFRIFCDVLELEHWQFELPPLNFKVILELDQKLSSPYYLQPRKRTLILFGSKEAMMASLYGDIKAWLEISERRSSRN